MSKRVYISADYDLNNGDRAVVDELVMWGNDNKHKTDFIDMSKVVSGTVAKDPDCRICDLKAEFNRQINVSSTVIFIVGAYTASRIAGSACQRMSKQWWDCTCTPYKGNANGAKQCKFISVSSAADGNVGCINSYSYLRHEFEQAKKKSKQIIVVYNSLNKQSGWLPSYLKEYEYVAEPFWVKDYWGNKTGNYQYIKKALGYE